MFLRDMIKKSQNGTSISKDALRQAPFFINKTSNSIICCSTSNMSVSENGVFSASNNDPFFLFKIPSGKKEVSVISQIQCKNVECKSAVYYSCNKNTPQFSENSKLAVGLADGQLHENHFVFQQPIYWLRYDPIDRQEDFIITKLGISETETDILASDRAEIFNGRKISETIFGTEENIPAADRNEISIFSDSTIAEKLFKIDNQLKEQGWLCNNTLVFVTHDLSDTGAPLLCRKMSAAARNMGIHTIMISLSDSISTQNIRQFSNDCDILLICKKSLDIKYISLKLSEMGIKRAILNTVVSGNSLCYFYEAGFFSVCLIHEMHSALRILQAQRWIKDYASYAGQVVFPAECVRDDFVRFGGNVNGKSVIIPQGFYKGIEPKTDSESKIKLFDKLGIVNDAKLIVGAGSINFRKGVDLLPLIAREMQNMDKTECHFLWLGTVSEDEFSIGLQDQIYRMRLSDKFHLFGHVSDENEYMNILGACDALALVSREDPYPSIMIEAMASGLPVVAFRGSGGAEELLADGRGYLVDYMDIPQFADVLHNVCQEARFADDVKRRAKEYIRKSYDFQEYVKSILNLF